MIFREVDEVWELDPQVEEVLLRGNEVSIPKGASGWQIQLPGQVGGL